MRNGLIPAPERHFITSPTPVGCRITGYAGPGGDVVIPPVIRGKTVTEIGRGAFAHCASLTSVVLPDSVLWLGWNAFKGCTALTSVVIRSGVARIAAGAFRDCTALTSVVLPDSIREIRRFAFCHCTSLTSVVLPKSVRLICHGAFRNCTALTSLVIPETVAKIQTCAFDGCPALTLRGEAGSCAHHYALRNGIPFALPEGSSVPELFHAVLPDHSGCTIVGCIAKAEAVHIPASINGLPVVQIGDHSFRYCSSLTSVVIPDSVKKIGDYAFQDCTALTSVVIPYSVTKISKSAFDGCDGLPMHVRESICAFRSFTRMRTPDGCAIIRYTGPGGDVIIPGEIGGTKVAEIIRCAFAGCSALTSVVIPDSVTKIGWFAFEHCRSLTSVVIPESVTYIDAAAFRHCTSLTSVVVPESVTHIGENAFDGCPDLTLHIREGCCAHQYAIDNGIPFALL